MAQAAATRGLVATFSLSPHSGSRGVGTRSRGKCLRSIAGFVKRSGNRAIFSKQSQRVRDRLGDGDKIREKTRRALGAGRR